MPAPDTVYRLRTRGTLFGQRVEFGMHFTRPPGGTSVNSLIDGWEGLIMPSVVAATSASVNWDDVLVSDVAPTGAEQVLQALTQPMPGTQAGDCLPGQNAVLVAFKTGTKGRRNRGRFYLPGIAEASTTNAHLSGAQLTAVQALAASLISHYGPGGSEPQWRLCIYSPIDTTPPPPKPFKPKTDELVTPITTSQVDTVIRTQRRRTIGVGG